MALLDGVDIVFELPYQFATQKAETFANGAVSILDAIGVHSFALAVKAGIFHPFYKTIDFLELNIKNAYDENIKKIYPNRCKLS